MKKAVLIALIQFTLSSYSNASHIVGGDIFVQWVGQNQYKFKLRYYIDRINSSLNPPPNMTIFIYDPITHKKIAEQVINPKLNKITAIGDSCETIDTSKFKIDEIIYESTTSLFLPDNPNGYYISSYDKARNALALNVVKGGVMTWFTMIPDPAIGKNSSPDFGDYPKDAYLCVSYAKTFSFPVTDSDGDSLAYKLTQPLSSNSGFFAGSGAYPFYPTLNWEVGYGLLNIVGGLNNMSINSITGAITSKPDLQGFYTVAICVEEYRDTTAAQNGPKVKIGETRRDMQFPSLNCLYTPPPVFLNTVPKKKSNFGYPR